MGGVTAPKAVSVAMPLAAAMVCGIFDFGMVSTPLLEFFSRTEMDGLPFERFVWVRIFQEWSRRHPGDAPSSAKSNGPGDRVRIEIHGSSRSSQTGS
jgi:hypothetical protein